MGRYASLVPTVRPAAELTGDRLALFESHKWLVGYTLRTFTQRWRALRVEYADLYQIALCGLWSAAADFDATLGLKFTTLAGHIIRNRACEYLDGEERRSRKRIAPESRDFDTNPIADYRTGDMPIEDWDIYRAMSPKMRDVLRARFDGATWQEVAERFNYSSAKTARTTARASLNNARRKLAEGNGHETA